MYQRKYDVQPTKWFDNITGYRVIRLADGAVMGKTFLCSEHVDARVAACGFRDALEQEASEQDAASVKP